MRISWDDSGSRLFEAGVDRGVFFPKSGPGVPWNGLTSVKETTEGEGALVVYADGQKIINQVELGDFAADISAITYPNEMYPYDGYQEEIYSGQPRTLFSLSYRSMIGNDVEGLSYGYRLHLVFNCMLSPTNRVYETLNDQSDIPDFEWKLSTRPVANPYNRPSSHFMIDSPSVEPGTLTAVENILYGVDGGSDPIFPTVKQLVDIFEANAIFTVVDNSDGTATITGPDDWVYPVATNQYHIESPSVTNIDDTHILARSY
jgi:hypothetical protein